MEYLYILIAVIGISGVFVTSKIYQRRYTKNFLSLMVFSFFLALGGFAFSFVVNGFTIRFSTVTLVYALIVAIAIGFDNIAGVVALKYCKMSLYTTFILSGGTVIPSIVGMLFWNEPIVGWRIAGISVVLLALVVPAFEKTDKRTSKIGLLLCLGVFVCNGINNVFTKLHQSTPNALGTQDFLIWENLCNCVLTLLIATVFVCITHTKKPSNPLQRERTENGNTLTIKRWIIPVSLILLTSLISGVGQTFNLMAAKTVPASLLYPLTTGGSMILSAVCGKVFFNEKITKWNAISLTLAALGTVLFVL